MSYDLLSSSIHFLTFTSVDSKVVNTLQWTLCRLTGKVKKLLEFKEVEILSRGRWTMHPDDTICLFQGLRTSLNKWFGLWTETMRTTVLQQYQHWQKLCLKMWRRFSRLALESHFFSPQLVLYTWTCHIVVHCICIMWYIVWNIVHYTLVLLSHNS